MTRVACNTPSPLLAKVVSASTRHGSRNSEMKTYPTERSFKVLIKSANVVAMTHVSYQTRNILHLSMGTQEVLFVQSV